jgi:hypothetical protein
MDISPEHIAHVTKDNTHLFDQEYIKPSIEMGEKLIGWLNSAKEDVIPLFSIEEQIQHEFEVAKNLSELKDAFQRMNKNHPELKSFINNAKDLRKVQLEG